jgi:uncharacterized membrane protein HdeD (DUF308 family)
MPMSANDVAMIYSGVIGIVLGVIVIFAATTIFYRYFDRKG